MATRVWKCDFCICETNKSKAKILIHEDVCDFNPKNKTCYSCTNHESDGFWIYGESFHCKIGKDHDKYEDEGNCPSWEQEGKTI